MLRNFGGLVVLSMLAVTSARAGDKPAKVEPVDFHKLQELMPDKAVGVNRSSLDGESMTIGEAMISQANADYTKPDSDGSDAHAAIRISDYGAAPQLVQGMTAWRMAPINIQNDQGYQRTVKLKDYPAFETFTKEGDSRQMIILVADRFVVNVDVSHVPEGDFRALVESLPLEQLARLK
jgi:hypothetical protein